MRTVRSDKYTKVVCLDEPGIGNACHSYNVLSIAQTEQEAEVPLQSVRFQEGPIQESGVNGVQNENLLAIVIDRLQGFQSGDYKCRENAVALTKTEEALMWSEKRIDDRKARNVEGTSIV